MEHFLPIDLGGMPPSDLGVIPEDAVLVSFAPIWSLAPWLSSLLKNHDSAAARHRFSGVVACSSSSVLTKRFAANRHDRELVTRLLASEESLEASCAQLNIPCRILRPTLIYGRAAGYGDRNLSALLAMMRRLPMLAIPAHTGQRQPIHISQLAAAALHLADRPEDAPGRLALGGDECLSYRTMLERLQQAARLHDAADPAGRCALLKVPTLVFHLLAAPLLPISAKRFEAVLRMEADLGPFTPVHTLLGTPAQPFPLDPLAWGRGS
jgi:nucleoside-diphosphate-sugar epimerase